MLDNKTVAYYCRTVCNVRKLLMCKVTLTTLNNDSTADVAGVLVKAVRPSHPAEDQCVI